MAKRKYGSGTVYLRKDGRWAGQIRHGIKSDGSSSVKNFYGKTKADVERQMNAFLEIQHTLSPLEVKKISLQQYMIRWLELYKKPVLAPTSYDRLECTILNNIVPHLGMIQMGSINTEDLQKHINFLVHNGGKDNNGYAYSSIKKVHDALSECFTHACIKGELLRNPVAGVVLPTKKSNEKLTPKDIKFMTAEQIELYCNEALRKHGNGQPVYRLGAGLVLILSTGLRLGEARALKWSDINSDDNYVQVSRSIVTVKDRDVGLNSYKHQEQNSLKTKSGYRQVPLNNRARKCLEELRKLNGDSDYLYATKTGKIVGGRNLYRTNSDICRAAGIVGIDIHALRHTFASMLFSKEKPVKTVSELLGHSDISTTLNTYVHLIPEQKKAAVDAIDF